MIVARVSGIKGSCELPAYKEWMPLTQVSFGFERERNKMESKDGGMDFEDVRPDDISTVTLDKFVDSASCELMALSMQDRLKTKGQNKPLNADISFLQTIAGQVFPFIQIVMENVLVKSWSLDGSGDERPTEQVVLWFEKVAMQYQFTEDGKTFSPAIRKGWDQKENKSWTPDKWR